MALSSLDKNEFSVGCSIVYINIYIVFRLNTKTNKRQGITRESYSDVDHKSETIEKYILLLLTSTTSSTTNNNLIKYHNY